MKIPSIVVAITSLFLLTGFDSAKFDTLVGPYLSEAAVEALASSLLQLDTATDVHALLALTRPAAADLKAVQGGS